MFLITLLMLVGAALCNDGGTKDCAKTTSDDKDCLPNTVHNAGGLVIELLKFLCEVLAATPDDLAKNYQAFLEKLNGVVTCIGCSLNNILAGFGTSYEFLQSLEGTKGADELLNVVGKILELLGISKETEDAVCHTLAPVITSECLKKLTKEDLPQLAKDLQALICEIKKPVLDMAAIINILNRIPCILGDVLKSLTLLKETPNFGNLLDGLARETVQKIVATLTASLQLPTLDPMCTLLGGGGGSGPGGLGGPSLPGVASAPIG